MKRKAFLFILMVTILACIFALSVSAIETTIEADSLSEIKQAVSDSSAGDEITVNLTGDIIIPKTSEAIVIDKDVTLTINLCGHIIVYSGGGGSAGDAYGMALKSAGAKLILNGSTDVDYLNYEEPQDSEIKVSNGAIVNNNEKGTVYPDYTGNGPCVVVFSGTVELNNMYVRNHNTGEWTIFFFPNLADVGNVNNIKATNSIIRAPKSRYAALGTRNCGKTLSESYVEIEGCVIYGTSDGEWLSMSADSYIKNSRFTKENSFKIDSYLNDSYAREGHEAILQNVIFENPKISSNTGAIYVKMIDCQFPNGMDLYVLGDSQGKTVFTIIETATCETAGRQAYIECWRGGGKTLTSFEEFPNKDTAYTEENPAFGHDIKSLAVYENGFTKQGYKRIGCTRCDDFVSGELMPLFACLGYSTQQSGGTGMLTSYGVNVSAIKEYENITGKEFKYGVFAVLQAKLGENDVMNEDGTFIGGTVNVDYTDTSFDIIEFKIQGYQTEEQMQSKIAMGVYAYIKDESSAEISYVQQVNPSEGEKYTFISYSDLVA